MPSLVLTPISSIQFKFLQYHTDAKPCTDSYLQHLLTTVLLQETNAGVKRPSYKGSRYWTETDQWLALYFACIGDEGTCEQVEEGRKRTL